MLRIKDDVKLSNLKWWGFERVKREYVFNYNLDNNYSNEWDSFIIVVDRHRKINIYYYIETDLRKYPENQLNAFVKSDFDSISQLFDLLYSLIHAGYIEKIGE